MSVARHIARGERGNGPDLPCANLSILGNHVKEREALAATR